jgi:hypothetical protein
MARAIGFLSILAACLAVSATSPAKAHSGDDPYDPRRLYGGAWLGFGGDAEVDGDDQFAGSLDTTLGGQLGMDWATHRFISLGFEVRIGAARWERMQDRTKLIDIDFKPRFRFVTLGPVELYATVPIGLTVPRPADIADEEVEAKPLGWNVGAGAGANVFLTDAFALNAEPIWLYHHYKVDGPANDFALKQFSLMLNAVLAF